MIPSKARNIPTRVGKHIVAKIPEIVALFPGLSQTLRPSQQRLREVRNAAAHAPQQGFLELEFLDENENETED